MSSEVPQTASPVVLNFTGVTVRRGPRTILQLNWQVREGERWVVLGPNGAGKTTLISLAAARMHPTTGTVDILGERLGRVSVFDLRPSIGLASSVLSEQLPAGETVSDIVLTGAYGTTGRWRESYDDVDRDRARELLAEFGVAALADRLYGSLSTGEQKRTQIARALMPDPELLLLDEPSAGLDLAARERLLADLHRLAISPVAPTMVLVTHDVETIPVGFTHLLLLRGGKEVAAGPLAETLTSWNLSSTFGMPVRVTAEAGRFFATAGR
ncbi:MAG: ABC transporter ATP-binding protein [Promicromonosporaceae bacterium]|nr:ABC transporter ATP-binding protein [Promicromonosporaceae bacterium]